MLRSSEFPVQTASAWGGTRWALGIGFAALLVVFAPTWIAMAKVWGASETYGHGMAVAPISAWLIWRQRAQLAALTPSVSWVGVAGLAVCCFGWLAAELAGINVVTQFAFTGMLVCLTLALTGWSVAKVMAFPLMFLFFMVPAGEALNPPLMDGTANATVWALQVSGIPVYREGMNFALPTGRWSVVEACSGLRYVLAAAMLGAFFAYLNFERWSQRIAFFVVSIAFAVVANWIRAFMIVLLGHFTQMKLGVGEDHVVYGWVFFGLTIFVLFWMGAKWHSTSSSAGSTQASTVAASTADTLFTLRVSNGARVLILIAALAPLGLTYVALSILRDVTPREDFKDRGTRILSGLSNSGSFVAGPLSIEPHFAGARAVVRGTIEPVHKTEVYLAYFARQHDGSEMIVFGNTVIADTNKAWNVISQRELQIEGEKSITVREWRLRQLGRERLMWSWYTVGDVPIVSEYMAKALTVWEMLSGRGDHSTVAVLSTELPLSVGGFHDDAANRDEFEAARLRLKYVVEQVRRVGGQAQ